MSDASQLRPPLPALSRGHAGVLNALLLALAVAAAAFAAWTWWEQRGELGTLREEVAQRLRAVDSDAREARAFAREAQESSRAAQGRIGALDMKVAESASQQAALEAMYQELARSREDWVLAEVDQLLTIASQQLQLAGNVQAALAALQTADASLARSDRPQYLPLRKVLGRDIEMLQSSPNLDVAGLMLRLDQVVAAVDSLPLLVYARPVAQEVGAPAAVEGLVGTRCSGGLERAEGLGARTAARRARWEAVRAGADLLHA